MTQRFQLPVCKMKDQNVHILLSGSRLMIMRPDFLVLRNNTIQLKKEHKYYYQVTGLMGVCGISKCYFLVWTLRGLHIELIEYDPGFWPNVLLKLELFFKSYMAKVMLGLHVIYFMVAQRYHSKICTILRRKNKK